MAAPGFEPTRFVTRSEYRTPRPRLTPHLSTYLDEIESLNVLTRVLRDHRADHEMLHTARVGITSGWFTTYRGPNYFDRSPGRDHILFYADFKDFHVLLPFGGIFTNTRNDLE